MNTTVAHIAHLVTDTPCLRVAGLGVFSTMETPSYYDSETRELHPPRTSVVFEHLPSTDTSAALTQSIARATGCTTLQAEETVRTDIGQIIDTLQSGNSIMLNSLGILRINNFGEITFEQQNFLDARGNFLLQPLKLRPLEHETVSQPEKTDTKTVKKNIFGRSLRIASSWAAAIIVFATVALVTGWINRIDNGNGNTTVASTMGTPARLAPQSDQPDTGRQPALVLIFNTPADGVSQARIRPDSTAATDSAPYCLIVASLANENEVQSYLEANSDSPYNLRVLRSQGRLRIYALSGNDAAGLTTEARSAGVYDRYPNAWVCRR